MESILYEPRVRGGARLRAVYEARASTSAAFELSPRRISRLPAKSNCASELESTARSIMRSRIVAHQDTAEEDGAGHGHRDFRPLAV